MVMLKLAPYVLKRYEPELYYFYNVKNKTFWSCNFATGSVIAALDGTLNFEEIIDILAHNNLNLDKEEIKTSLSEVFEFLLKEEFVIE